MILVVGGAGYVGLVLVEALLARNYRVRVLDPLWFGDRFDRIKNGQYVDLVVGDIRTCDPDILQGVTDVVVLGGFSNDPMSEYRPESHYKINVVGTSRLARMCKEAGIGKFVFASSCSVYDQGLDETYDILCTEESPVYPTVAYSSSKYEAERILRKMAGGTFCPVILRKGTIYGFSHRMRYDLVVNTFIKDALTKGVLTLHSGGEVWRPLIDVRDVARAYIAAVEAEPGIVCGEVFNISGHNYRVSELALRVKHAMDTRIKVEIEPDYTPRPARSYRVSTEKARCVLGWQPAYGAQGAVWHIIDSIREHGYTDFDNPVYYNTRWMEEGGCGDD
jgi:nucleoside-diphosphate-sugar epimerase